MIARLHGVADYTEIETVFEVEFDEQAGQLSFCTPMHRPVLLAKEPADFEIEFNLRKLGALLWTCSRRRDRLALRCEWPGLFDPIRIDLIGIVSIGDVEFRIGFKRRKHSPIWLGMRSGRRLWKWMRTTPEGADRFLDELGAIILQIAQFGQQNVREQDDSAFHRHYEGRAIRLFCKHGISFSRPNAPVAFLSVALVDKEAVAVEIPKWLGPDQVEAAWENWASTNGAGTILRLNGGVMSGMPDPPTLRYLAGGVVGTATLADTRRAGDLLFFSNILQPSVPGALSPTPSVTVESHRIHFRFVPDPRNRIEDRWVFRAAPLAQIEVLRLGRFPRCLGAVVGR